MVEFICEHCRREVTAPDEAAGKRGKCPYCNQTSYIPAPKSDDEEDLALAPLDDQADPQQDEELAELRKMEKLMLAEDAATPASEPLEQRDKVTAEDVQHYVVNYCLDMAASRLDRAESHAAKLKRFGYAGIEAADDFLCGKALEPALDSIPVKVLHGFLEQLKSAIRGD